MSIFIFLFYMIGQWWEDGLPILLSYRPDFTNLRLLCFWFSFSKEQIMFSFFCFVGLVMLVINGFKAMAGKQ